MTLLVLLIPVVEWRTLKHMHSGKEWALFGMLWIVALLTMLGEWQGWPLPRPLDWIRVTAAPLGKLFPK
ncbi:hypothetical protein [Paenibacillus sp. 1P07SE]|uniref:hypothetical protein n=1 Tax=Paenibacillus sp. 1P07SE TaxID=3132209 RepID=UPI0039A400AD